MMATTHDSSAVEGRRDTPGIAGCRKILTVKPRSNDLEPGYRDRKPGSDLRGLVGDTGIEPVTSTVSGCRATAPDDARTALSWEPNDGRHPGFPLLTLVPLASVGTLWGQPWGHDRRAARRTRAAACEGCAWPGCDRSQRLPRVSYDLASTTLVRTQRCFPILRMRLRQASRPQRLGLHPESSAEVIVERGGRRSPACKATCPPAPGSVGPCQMLT